MSKTASEIVRNEEIAEYLEGGATALADGAVKWVRKDLGHASLATGKVQACAVGACNYAKFGKPWGWKGSELLDWYPYTSELAGTMLRLYGVLGLPDYNDTQATNVDEVIDALRTVAKEFRNSVDPTKERS